MTTAKFSKILDGYEFCAMADLMETRALVSLERGTVHIVSSDLELDLDEALPEDIDTGPYLALPDKRELDLGRDLVMEFTEKVLPGSVDTVRDFFHRRGAYARFKDFLDRRGQLEAWFAYERTATELRLRQWCADHGIDLV
ncbi:hypothetical protein [Paracidovorax sp. MALMAid1276]|uniref:hypothetical protein n=1 Tax=Paracidovorax sp. MALMAid1276 TaxID=3411631 RepID=UPI003B9B247D